MTIVNVIHPNDIGRGLKISGNKVVTDVPDLSAVIPGAAAPSQAAVQAYLATISPAPLPGTLLTWGGTPTKPDLVYLVDKSNQAVKISSALRDVTGQSAFVINPTNGPTTWANGATENTPIATLAITNPSADNPLSLDIFVYHGVFCRLATAASPKAQTIGVYSLIYLDSGSGSLLPFSSNPNAFGSNQIASQSTQADVGANADSGVQNASTLLSRITVNPGATVTLRVQSQLFVRDGNANAVAWSYCQLAARGKVQL